MRESSVLNQGGSQTRHAGPPFEGKVCKNKWLLGARNRTRAGVSYYRASLAVNSGTYYAERKILLINRDFGAWLRSKREVLNAPRSSSATEVFGVTCKCCGLGNQHREKIVRQTEAVVKGHLSIPRREASIFDTGARPIRRGRARADTEFGRKVLIG